MTMDHSNYMMHPYFRCDNEWGEGAGTEWRRERDTIYIERKRSSILPIGSAFLESPNISHVFTNRRIAKCSVQYSYNTMVCATGYISKPNSPTQY